MPAVWPMVTCRDKDSEIRHVHKEEQGNNNNAFGYDGNEMGRCAYKGVATPVKPFGEAQIPSLHRLWWH